MLLGKKQKAQTLREAHAAERQRMKAHIGALEERRAELSRKLAAHKRQSRQLRRERLAKMRADIAAARRGPPGRLRRAFESLAKARSEYRAWLHRKKAEGAALRAELEMLRQSARAAKEQAPAERKAIIDSILSIATQDLERLDAKALEDESVIVEAIKRAQREIHAERYDLKTWAANRRADKLRDLKQRWAKQDIVHAVDAELSTAEEFAVWKHERDSIMRDARRLGLIHADQIAELVKERAEMDPEKAIDLLSQDVDAWVKAEMHRQQWDIEEPF